MAVKYVFNPTTGKLDITSVELPGGSTTQVQFNDGGVFGGDADLTWNKTTNVLGITGDVNLIDGGTYTTTLQTITPTANRTISLPDATGTVALIAGSSGQLFYNNAGNNAGISTLTYDGSILTTSGRFINSYNAAGIASAPAKTFTGTWFTGGSATTTKPHLLIEPTGTTSTGWSTAGTGFGVNAASGFTGNLLDLQVNGSSRFAVAGFSANLFTNGGNVAGTDGIFFSATSFANQRHGIGTRYASASSGISFWALNACYAAIANNGFYVDGTVGLGFSPGNPISTNPDAFIRRHSSDFVSANVAFGGNTLVTSDAANTLAQRNGTNAQTFRVYGTFTDASNFVRASLSSTSTAITLAAQTAGTGADDIPLNLTAAGTGTVKVNSVAEVVLSSTVAGLPAAPVVGMLTRVTDASAPAMGAIVAGGGAAAALVWYNGTNWRVIGV